MAEDTEVFDLTHDEDAAHSPTSLVSANGSTAEHNKRKAPESMQYAGEERAGEQVEREVSEFSNTPAKKPRFDFDSLERLDHEAEFEGNVTRARNPFAHPSSAFGDGTRRDVDRFAHSPGSDNDHPGTFKRFALPSGSEDKSRGASNRFALPSGPEEKTRGASNRFALASDSEDEERAGNLHGFVVDDECEFPSRFALPTGSKDDTRGAPNPFAHPSGTKEDLRQPPARFAPPSRSDDDRQRSKLDYESFSGMQPASVGRRKAKTDMLPPPIHAAASGPTFQLSRGESIRHGKQYLTGPYPKNATLLSKDTSRMYKQRDAYLQHRNPHPTTTTHAQQTYDRVYPTNNNHNQPPYPHRPQIPIPTLPPSITDRATDWPSLFATLNTIPDLLRTVAAELEQPFLAMDHRCTVLERRVHDAERANAALGREVEGLRRWTEGLEGRFGEKIEGLMEFVYGVKGEGDGEERGGIGYGGLPDAH